MSIMNGYYNTMTNTMKKKIVKEVGEKEFNDLARAVSRYLVAMGGNALVVGGIAIESTAMKYNFILRIRFTGKAPTQKV